MTNAIEQTKREMYEVLATLKGRIEINYSIKDMQRGADEFEHSLEAHLEALRQDRAKIIEERDELRNKHQALQMASQTAAEVIRGLRSELLEARECNATAKKSEEPESANTGPCNLGFAIISSPTFADAQNARNEYFNLLLGAVDRHDPTKTREPLIRTVCKIAARILFVLLLVGMGVGVMLK